MNAPTVMRFGDAEIISPDGSEAIPPDLWPELELLILLQPEPPELRTWAARIEASLGVTDAHRAFVQGGDDAVRSYVVGKRKAVVEVDDWCRVSQDMPFPGEGPEPSGHMLAERPDDVLGRKLARRRVSGIRDDDHLLAWFIARSATRMEDRAERNLAEQGYTVYVPRITRWGIVSQHRPKQRLESPLFTGYFFVGIGKKQSIGQVSEIDGVHDMVRTVVNGERVPQRIAFEPIRELVELEVSGAFDKTDRTGRRDPKPGTPVNIIAGRFQGWPAKFHERREDERIVLLLQGIAGGRPTRLTIDAEKLDLPEDDTE